MLELNYTQNNVTGHFEVFFLLHTQLLFYITANMR